MDRDKLTINVNPYYLVHGRSEGERNFMDQRKRMMSLTPLEKDVFETYWAFGRRLRGVSTILGCTPYKAREALVFALYKIRGYELPKSLMERSGGFRLLRGFR